MMPYRNLFIDGRLVSSLFVSSRLSVWGDFLVLLLCLLYHPFQRTLLFSSPPFRKADAKIEVFINTRQTNRNLFLEYFLVGCAKDWHSDMLHNIFFCRSITGEGRLGGSPWCDSERSLLRWQTLLAPMGNAPRCVFGSSSGQRWQAVWFELAKVDKRNQDRHVLFRQK